MKKVIYSIALFSAMLFAGCSSEDRGTSTEAVSANENSELNATDNTSDMGTAGSTAATADADATYREHADMISGEMARDLKLDDSTAARVSEVYYNRNRQIGELEQGSSFSSTARMGGRTNESTDMNTGTSGTTDRTTGTMNNDATTSSTGTENTGQSQMSPERTTIDQTTDTELKSILTPEQYRQYEQNRDRYNNLQLNNNTGTNPNNNLNNNNNRNRLNSTDTGTGTGSGTNTGTQTGTGTGTGTDTGNRTGSGTNTGTRTGSGTDIPTGGNQ